jgi:hypothetical protein
MSRIYAPEEIQAFNDAERELAALGFIVSDKLNTEVVIGWFDQHPEVPATKESIMNFVQHPNVKPRLRWKSEAQMKFEKAAAHVPPQDLDTLERFLKANRLWPDDDGAYLNACQFIATVGNRPYTHDYLAHWALPNIQGTSREPLHWKTPGQGSTYRLHGQHSGGDAHFAPKTESNVSFSHRVANFSTEIPRPAPASAKVDAYQWDRLANSLVADSGRHSDTAAIQHAVKAAGGGEAGYRAGLAMQKRIRQDRERGR